MKIFNNQFFYYIMIFILSIIMHSTLIFNTIELQGLDDNSDISELAKSLKDKVLKIQDHKFQGNKESNSLFFNKRDWNETINISEKQISLSKEELLTKIKFEYQAYISQSKKFQEIIDNTNKGTEFFFPKESVHLFKEYIEVVDKLKANLILMEENIKKNLK